MKVEDSHSKLFVVAIVDMLGDNLAWEYKVTDKVQWYIMCNIFAI